MLNLRVALTLREFEPENGATTRRIRGYLRFLDERGLAVGPEMRTEHYDWSRWSEWLAGHLAAEERDAVGGVLQPSAKAELGNVRLRVPNLTPFYLASEAREHD